VKRAGIIAVVLLAASIGAVAAFARPIAPTPARCGGATWHLQTLSDPQRKKVVLSPKATSVGEIVAKPFPRPVPRLRRTAFQRQNWEVIAQITAFHLEEAGLRLILFDHGRYMHAFIPVPSCLTASSRARTAITDAWSLFATSCGRPAPAYQPLGAIAYVSGIGFWSERTGERGAAANGAELNPVTGFRIVAGC